MRPDNSSNHNRDDNRSNNSDSSNNSSNRRLLAISSRKHSRRQQRQQRRRHPSLLPSELSTTPPSTREPLPDGGYGAVLFSQEDFLRVGKNTRRNKADRGKRFPPPSLPSLRPSPPKPDWVKETRELDRKLSIQIEELLERRARLRETADRVTNRPPLKGLSREERNAGLSPLRPPPADYVDGPGGGRRKKKKKKKKKTAVGTSLVTRPASFLPVEPARGIKVVEKTTLRGRDLIPVTRYRPEETWKLWGERREATNAGARPPAPLPPHKQEGRERKRTLLALQVERL